MAKEKEREKEQKEGEKAEMTEREKLIELIVQCDKENDILACYNDRPKRAQAAEILADHLLSNGVIVPPCKVGDTVYIVDGTTDGIVEGKITHLEYNIYTTPREWITVIGNYPFFGEHEEKNRIDLLLGKTVFLTKEEAENALKERSKE